MKIKEVDSSNDCGGFRPPKGKLDTQMYPECEGTETDRNIVKKTVEKRKKKKRKATFNLKQYRFAYGFGQDPEDDGKKVPGRGLPKVVTTNALTVFDQSQIAEAYGKFINADFGDVDAEDNQKNMASLAESETAYMMGVYKFGEETLWIICDGSAVTFLLPEDY